jgi:glyceraldehyde-3-phosphate dehydrogenase/erythrose-4-phosphate dehydrogenase
MTIKVGINGFGRIGRMAFRAISKEFADIEVVGINDLLDADYLAYMLKYDSVHGNFDGTIAVDGNNLVVNGKTIRLTAERDPADLKWSDIGADLIIESPGTAPIQTQRSRRTSGPGTGCQSVSSIVQTFVPAEIIDLGITFPLEVRYE